MVPPLDDRTSYIRQWIKITECLALQRLCLYVNETVLLSYALCWQIKTTNEWVFWNIDPISRSNIFLKGCKVQLSNGPPNVFTLCTGIHSGMAWRYVHSFCLCCVHTASLWNRSCVGTKRKRSRERSKKYVQLTATQIHRPGRSCESHHYFITRRESIHLRWIKAQCIYAEYWK